MKIDDVVDRVDWVQAKADLVADGFDNGGSPEALRRSFAQSHVALAWEGDRWSSASGSTTTRTASGSVTRRRNHRAA